MDVNLDLPLVALTYAGGVLFNTKAYHALCKTGH